MPTTNMANGCISCTQSVVSTPQKYYIKNFIGNTPILLINSVVEWDTDGWNSQ